jgi:hypothetical protein
MPAMLFIDNKYTNWYYKIISNAQLRVSTGYVEKHHIIPRSLGGSDNNSNLVKLTAREHFICHWLLTKSTDGNNKEKMIYALHRMQGQNKHHNRYETKITARVYENVRIQHAQIHSKNMKGCIAWNKGLTKETSDSVARMGQKSGNFIPWNKGILAPSISAGKTGKKRKPFTDAWLNNMSNANKGKIPWNKGSKGQPLPKNVCRLIDKKEMNISHFVRWTKKNIV